MRNQSKRSKIPEKKKVQDWKEETRRRWIIYRFRSVHQHICPVRTRMIVCKMNPWFSTAHGCFPPSFFCFHSHVCHMYLLSNQSVLSLSFSYHLISSHLISSLKTSPRLRSFYFVWFFTPSMRARIASWSPRYRPVRGVKAPGWAIGFRSSSSS